MKIYKDNAIWFCCPDKIYRSIFYGPIYPDTDVFVWSRGAVPKQ